MGFFKESIQLLRSPELKELKRRADAQPRVSMLEGVRMANEAMTMAPVWEQQAAAAASYAGGTPGTAKVLSLADSGMMINQQPVMDMELEVTVPGGAPYTVRHRQIVAFAALANFQPGKVFPVRVNPSDPNTVVIG